MYTNLTPRAKMYDMFPIADFNFLLCMHQYFSFISFIQRDVYIYVCVAYTLWCPTEHVPAMFQITDSI